MKKNDSKRSKKKTIFNFLILVLITGLVLYFSLKDNYDEIIHQLTTLNWFWLVIGMFLVISYWFLRSISFHHFVKEFKPEYKFQNAFKIALETQFFNAITPFASGGQPFQIYTLKQDGISLTKGTNIVIQNFIVYQIALILLGSIAVIANHFMNIFTEVGILRQLVSIGFIANGLVTAFLFLVAFAKKANQLIIHNILKILSKLKIVKNIDETRKKWEDYINDFYQGAKKLIKNKKHFTSLILINLLALISLYLVPLAILYSTGDFTSFNGIIAIITSAYVMLIGSFVPIPGGTGGLEYGFMAFYGNFIIGSKLTAIMLVWRLITYYFGMIVGAMAVNIKKKR